MFYDLFQFFSCHCSTSVRRSVITEDSLLQSFNPNYDSRLEADHQRF